MVCESIMAKLNYPMETYVSFTAFMSSLLLLYGIATWQNPTNYFIPVVWFIVIFPFTTIITALIFQRFFGCLSVGNAFIGGSAFSVSWRAALLGCVFAVGWFLSNNESVPTWRPFGLYLCILSFFHWSEYFATSLSNRGTLNVSSFLLNHSVEYWAAAACSWIEFGIESYFLPAMKAFQILTWLGVVVCIVGEVFRKLAMFTAGQNFTHLIQYKRRPHHQLVTHGIYSLFRHPSYVGWFWWSIGTQITLCNPVCTAVYAFISWRFFKERIFDEEITLINFFGECYVDYQKRVPTGLPGIVGFQP